LRAPWSPDGASIVYRSADTGKLHVYTVATGDDHALEGDYRPLGWAFGGAALIVASNYQPPGALTNVPSFEMGLLDLATAQLTAIPKVPQFWVSPDGFHAAYLTVGQRADGLPGLGVLDLRSGKARPIQDSLITYPGEGIPPDWVRFSADGQSLYWVGGDGAGYRARIDGAELTRLLEAGGVGGFDFSPDFAVVAYDEFGQDPSGDVRVTLRAVSSDGSAPLQIDTRTDPSQGIPFPYAWRP
jgi:hypothetical protein